MDMMPAPVPKNLLTIPSFQEIPFLVHGFGDSHWTEDNIGLVDGWGRFQTVILKQVHSDIVHVVDASVTNRGTKLRGDGLITSAPFLFLAIKTADCLPVLMADPSNRVVAAVHCGWRSTSKIILDRAVRLMQSRFGTEPTSLLVAFGPCIGPACYEVGEDVRAEFSREKFPRGFFQPHPEKPGKYWLDLREANRGLLLRLGVKPANIHSVDACTHCDRRFLSFRRDREKSGRMLSFIGLTD